MKKLIIPNNKKLLMKEIRKCAVVVYDISLDKKQIHEAIEALKGKNKIKYFYFIIIYFI